MTTRPTALRLEKRSMDNTCGMTAQTGVRDERSHARLSAQVDTVAVKTSIPLVFRGSWYKQPGEQPASTTGGSVTGVRRIRMLAWLLRVVLPCVVMYWSGRMKRALIR
jgi:hypothetical protein